MANRLFIHRVVVASIGILSCLAFDGWGQGNQAAEAQKQQAETPKDPPKTDASKTGTKIVADASSLTLDTSAGCCAARTVTFTADPSVAKVAIKASKDFRVQPESCVIKPAAPSCVVEVSYIGASAEAITGEITASDDTGHSIVVKVSTMKGACCTPPAAPSKSLAFAAIAYLFAFLTIRWYLIAKPTRKLLEAQVAAVGSRLAAIPNAPKEVAELLAKAAPEESKGGMIFWSDGTEIAGWAYVHEVEERIASLLPEPQVRTALELAEAELRDFKDPVATSMADRIKSALDASANLAPAYWSLVTGLERLSGEPVRDLGKQLDLAIAGNPPDILGTARVTLAVLSFRARLVYELDILRKSEAVARDPVLKEFLDEKAKTIGVDPIEAREGLDAALAKYQTDPSGIIEALKSARTQVGPEILEHARDIRERIEARYDVRIDRLRALLSSALGIIYDARDNSFSTLMTWHNKAAWLVTASLVLIVALGAALGNGVLFLLGAAGGVMSRMTRALTSKEVPTDYGAFWTTLFLSPLMGALAAWAGILVVVLAAKLQILGAAIDASWCCPTSPTTMAIAILLGWSERFLDNLLNATEGKVLPQKKSELPAPASDKAADAKGKTG
ncbi:MAG TPA: hypothetical protein VGQ34_06080 [Sphingomicrobium sp.]|nr:hypothetical protein [Sphingomicrobium sp.]